MLGKRGQFFLIAALVISGILIGFATFYTSTQSPKEDTTVFDLSSELNYENAQVIDQGVFTNIPQDQINAHVANLTTYYASQNPTTDFTILVGAGNQVTLIQCLANNTGTVSVGTGGSNSGTSIINNRCSSISAPRASSSSPDAIGDVVTLQTQNGATINVTLSLIQNQYIVLGSSSGSQRYTASAGFSYNSPYHDCSGSEPSDPSYANGIIRGGSSYPTGYTPTSWTYVSWANTLTSPSSSSIGACKWTCNSGYTRNGNSVNCKRQ